jgi:hypothetical protein
MAHKDGWFEGAGDNASGVASLLGLAEFYARIPQARRRRTIVFLGLDGHHNLPEGNVGREWLTARKTELFAKTALMINIEHPSTIQTQSRPRYYPGDEIAWANTYMPMQWYAGGKPRPELQQIAWNAFKRFGVSLTLDPSPTPPASDLMYFYRFVPGVDVSEYHHYFHTDWETPETVPWTGLGLCEDHRPGERAAAQRLAAAGGHLTAGKIRRVAELSVFPRESVFRLQMNEDGLRIVDLSPDLLVLGILR